MRATGQQLTVQDGRGKEREGERCTGQGEKDERKKELSE